MVTLLEDPLAAANASIREQLRRGERPPRVVIIGAGAAGLCMAIRCRDAGLRDIVILEASDGVGGTWKFNSYPGAACDVPSMLYSFSFAPKHDWTRKFAFQPEILKYFESVVDRFDLRRDIRFNARVVSAIFDEGRAVWVVTLEDGSTIEGEILVSGLGQLDRPYIPDFEGLDSFEGPAFHSARWRHDVDLRGKRIGVVGSGASAIQFVPEIVPDAESVTIFQRTASYVMPKPDRPFTERERRLFRRFPSAARAARWWTYLRLETNFFLLMRKKSPIGKLLQKKVTSELRPLATERMPADALVPDYLPGCKRLLISNDYYAAILKPNVHAVTSAITGVRPHGIETADGQFHELDVVIFGTGFRATEFLSPLDVRGLGGRRLTEEWRQGAQAHLGMMVHGFPNLFILYGPSTNLGHNSIIFMIEAQTRWIVQVIALSMRKRFKWVEVRRDAQSKFLGGIDRLVAGTVWSTHCESWYKTAAGRVTNNWPASTLSYWKRTRRLDDSEIQGTSLRSPLRDAPTQV